MLASANPSQIILPNKYIIFITLRLGKSTLTDKPFTQFL